MTFKSKQKNLHTDLSDVLLNLGPISTKTYIWLSRNCRKQLPKLWPLKQWLIWLFDELKSYITWGVKVIKRMPAITKIIVTNSLKHMVLYCVHGSRNRWKRIIRVFLVFPNFFVKIGKINNKRKSFKFFPFNPKFYARRRGLKKK